MNRQEKDVLNALYTNPFISQQVLVNDSGYSLSVVNCVLGKLSEAGYIDEKRQPILKATVELRTKVPENAIILAAGVGMRMVPINMEVPKGLLEINNEPLIERTIKQLHEVNIREIYVVVGFMKESFEYLIDKYGVELVVNTEYAVKNNLHSLKLVLKHLSNTYIIPCDIWCAKNPYRYHEFYSWYMVSNETDEKSSVQVNSKFELISIPDDVKGNCMTGICYLTEEKSAIVRKCIRKLCKDSSNDDAFWEIALYQKEKMIVDARVVSSVDVIEINTYEQLRAIDSSSKQLKTDTMQIICKVFDISLDKITDIGVLKKGMTNRSFVFRCNDKKYIMRVPGEGTEQLINRRQETEVYRVISSRNICDNIVYINSKNGYKITEFLEDTRVCDPYNEADVKKCMKYLNNFHKMKLSVKHEFNLYEQIEFYETLWGKMTSIYKDYKQTKENVWSLRSYIDMYAGEKVLTHIDAVPDNFLFINKDGVEDIRLIDWEYAGMQDPHVDIAMFAIYSLYDRTHVDSLIDAYFFEGGGSAEIRIKIYCYIAVCGLLWSNWCEYKKICGVEFGEYSVQQYCYAKDYYEIVQDELKKLSMEENTGGEMNA